MSYWIKMREYEQDGFRLVVSRHDEEVNPRDCFDCFDSEEQKEDFFRKIESGFYDWFGFRVQAYKHGALLGEEQLWCCCYENAHEIFTDGTCDDIAGEAIHQAKKIIQQIIKGEQVTV